MRTSYDRLRWEEAPIQPCAVHVSSMCKSARPAICKTSHGCHESLADHYIVPRLSLRSLYYGQLICVTLKTQLATFFIMAHSCVASAFPLHREKVIKTVLGCRPVLFPVRCFQCASTGTSSTHPRIYCVTAALSKGPLVVFGRHQCRARSVTSLQSQGTLCIEGSSVASTWSTCFMALSMLES